AARSGKAGDKTEPDRVFGGDEHDGDRRGYRLGSERWIRGGRGDHSDPSLHQVRRQLWKSIELILGPAVFNGHVLALDVAAILQALAKCAQTIRHRVRRSGVKKPDHRHRRLLRPRRERPRRRPAEQRYELAPFHPPTHSITSSARASSVGGTSRPSALAVVRLITRSNLVGCSTGMSPGFAPRRILST